MDHDADATLYLVFSNPIEGKDDEFNEWYDTVHLPEVLATPGIKTAQRFSLRETQITHHSPMPKPAHGYLIVYEMEGDVDEVMGKIQAAAQSGEMLMNDALDLTSVSMSFWAPLGPMLVK